MIRMQIDREGAKYSDDDAGVEVLASPMKKPLTMNLYYFDYGKNDKGGYWDYNYMVIQFQDVIDCLIVMHPKYHFFLHSHEAMLNERPKGLGRGRFQNEQILWRQVPSNANHCYLEGWFSWPL